MADIQIYGTLCTDIGNAAIANAVLTETKVNFTQIAVGDANGTPYTPLSNMTELKHQVWSGPIGEVVQDPEEANRMVLHAVLPSSVGGWVMREIGVLDDQGRLIAIGNTPEIPKEAVTTGAIMEMDICIYITVVDARGVNVVIDPTVVIASKADINKLNKLLQGHKSDQTAHVTTLACTKTDTVYALTGLTATEGIVSCVFKADADYAEGDTFTIEGTAVAAQQQNGDSLDDGCFKSGAAVPCIYDVDNKTLNFKQSGGTKLNLFVQPDEPATKDGIWIQAPEKHMVKNITGKDSFTIGGEVRMYDSSLKLNSGEAAYNTYNQKGTALLSYSEDLYQICGQVNNNGSSPLLTLSIYRWNHITNTTSKVYYKELTYVIGTGIAAVIACIKNNKLYAAVSYNYKSNAATIICTFNLITQTGTEVTTNLYDLLTRISNDVWFVNFCGQVGYKDSTVYYIVNMMSLENSPRSYQIRLYSYNFETGHCTHLAVISSTNTTLAEGVVVDNKLYYQYFINSSDTSKSSIYIQDLTTNTNTRILLSLGYYLYSSSCGIAAYENKLYFICIDGCLYEFDINANTVRKVIDSFHFSAKAIVQVGTSLVALDDSNYLQYYDFISETLLKNSFAILDGTSKITKLITSDKMNYIRMVFQDVWWYDTDFKEYPTYIGNGTSWTKYKN